ncbi:Uncharacterised protein [Mycobacteroides abscessus subsp. bolletii]|uniref:hypothetical protein n=1 Tax=Mycobacteroides abscessus TaxID=36809 RepID=UPI00092B890A|nr:hypothetical protein [Mycobacteroides abscessus]SII54956.1 Uncharacterised protein [Mycobacteroides abscessus subsp. bolletii]SLD43354.1 Uncharacterised protein [Mycobacteroides abscessus subsp. bolletii]SLD72463.1 Uncharacterised protein [Mycobacteroides abscessus subsp. bolletii]
MSDIDPKRAEALRRKYGMDNPPEANNAVGRILAGEQLHGRVFTRDSAELFDPIRSPRMHDKLMAALRDLRTGRRCW